MLSKIPTIIRFSQNAVSLWKVALQSPESTQLLLGALLSKLQEDRLTVDSLGDVEFKVFSQYGDDGIIQWLIKRLPIAQQTFIEFGVANYRESNTRFLLMNNNWQGFVMDGSAKNIREIISSEYYWKFDLRAMSAFIDAENVQTLMAESQFERDLGILHIDVDGNDYWLWKTIDQYSPRIVIMEYNAVFDLIGPVTVPYSPTFRRSVAHHSHLYFGASLAALTHLGQEKGYALVGCNRSGNNAYFVRRDLINGSVCEKTYAEAFVDSRFREARDEKGRLTYLRGPSRIQAMRGMPVINVKTGERVTI